MFAAFSPETSVFIFAFKKCKNYKIQDGNFAHGSI
jgi:hypothetical protein